MWSFLTVILIVVPLSLFWGALLALVLRELHIRHPLPLGGTIGQRKPSKTQNNTAENSTAEITEDAEGQETATEPTEDDALVEISNLLASSSVVLPKKEPVAPDPAEVPTENNTEISVFDEAENIPKHWPIGEVLESMTSEVSPTIPSDFERIIEESSQPNGDVLSELRTLTDDLDLDDLRALDEALPGGRKIDFSEELETEHELETSEAVPSMAQELLGENFNIDALAEQAKQLKESLQPPVLDIQEDATGTVQVSSPFINAVPQLADFSVPETIMSSFSSDWIQEAGGMSEPIAGDLSQFCFTEESRPMFVKKKKNVRG